MTAAWGMSENDFQNLLPPPPKNPLTVTGSAGFYCASRRCNAHCAKWQSAMTLLVQRGKFRHKVHLQLTFISFSTNLQCFRHTRLRHIVSDT